MSKQRLTQEQMEARVMSYIEEQRRKESELKEHKKPNDAENTPVLNTTSIQANKGPEIIVVSGESSQTKTDGVDYIVKHVEDDREPQNVGKGIGE